MKFILFFIEKPLLATHQGLNQDQHHHQHDEAHLLIPVKPDPPLIFTQIQKVHIIPLQMALKGLFRIKITGVRPQSKEEKVREHPSFPPPHPHDHIKYWGENDENHLYQDGLPLAGQLALDEIEKLDRPSFSTAQASSLTAPPSQLVSQ